MLAKMVRVVNDTKYTGDTTAVLKVSNACNAKIEIQNILKKTGLNFIYDAYILFYILQIWLKKQLSFCVLDF